MDLEFVDKVPLAPGDSSEQQQAEHLMRDELSRRLGTPLDPVRIDLPDGVRVEIDGADPSGTVYVEFCAHQGPPKVGQVRKVVMDAFKLAFLGRTRPGARLLLVFSDDKAASRFRSRAWYSEAIRQCGIEVAVVNLPADVAAGLLEAQRRQFR